jgi:hypothetical protein
MAWRPPNCINAGDSHRMRLLMLFLPLGNVRHVYYDMVTPYFSSQRLIEQMKMLPEQRQNLHFKNFFGGHMFYTWEKSRIAFRDWVKPAYR